MKIKNMRLIFCIMFLMLVMSLGDSMNVNAKEVSEIASGIFWDKDIVWSLDSDGLLTISGKGEMQNYGYDHIPWRAYVSEIRSVSISDDIQNIADYAFYECSNLANINIPDKATRIGTSAFSGCSSLTSVAIPSSVKRIKNSAFCGCSGLTSIEIPSSVTSIEDGAFIGCSSLVNLEVNTNNVNYSSENNMLYNKEKTSLICCPGGKSRTVTIPSSVTSIGACAFIGCSRLTSIEIPSSVTSIGAYAFDDCSGLTSIEIPSSVTSIESYTFYGCSGLTSIEIPSSVTSIGSCAFARCSGLTSISIPSSVTSIGYGAFEYGSQELTIYGTAGSYVKTYAAKNNIKFSTEEMPQPGDNIADADGFVINNGVLTKYIGTAVEVMIPDSVISIGDGTFSHCSGLTSITIPDSIVSVGDSAFKDCINLKYVFYNGTSTQWDSILVGKNNSCLTSSAIHYSTTDHIWNSDYTVDTESTCAVTGSKSIHCGVCDIIKDDSSVSIPVNENHNTELRNEKEPTYVSTGYTGDQICTVCGKIIESGTIIPVKERIEATGKFALMKSYLLRKGQTDDDGNKYFHDIVMVSDNIGSIAVITYIEDEAKFQFAYGDLNNNRVVSTIVMFIEENGSQTVTVDYSYDMFSLNASATFDVSSYKPNGKVYFEKTSSNILDNSEIQDLCNSELKAAFLGWDVIFLENFGLDVNMADMGFTSYEKTGTHTWTPGIISKEATCEKNGIKTYTCIVCGATMTEDIPKSNSHTWNPGIITKKPTTVSEGEKTYICTICKATRTEKIPKLKKPKKSQKIKVITTKKINAKKVAKKAQSFKLSAKSTSGNKVKYKFLKKNKNIKFTASSGKITVKKGTGKGKYRIKVRMTVSGNSKYDSYSTTKTITIKVK